MMLRPLTIAACLAAFALAVPGHASPTPLIVDPKGDALSTDPGVDIVSADFGTKGTKTVKKVRGRQVTTYTPTDLVVEVTLAAPPTKQQGTTLHVRADVDSCGTFELTHSPATALGNYDNAYIECAGDSSDPTDTGSIVAVSPKIRGNSIVWTLKLKTFGSGFGPGSLIENIVVYTAPVEPVMGIVDTGSLATQASFDSATGGPYVVR